MKSTTSNAPLCILLAGYRSSHRWGIIIALLTFSLGCSNGGSQAPADNVVVVGGVRCVEPTWLVGFIDPQKQQRYSHTFTVENQTNAAIPIQQVKPDCACIICEEGPREIPAHESAEIKIRFDAPLVPGQFDHMVHVKLGLAEPANLFLKIHGTVVPTAALHAEPSSLDFGRISEEETRTRTICVSRYDFSRVGVSKLTSSFKGCTLEAQRASQSQTVLVSVTLRGASLSPGSPSEFVTVETDYPSYALLKIPVKFEVGTIADTFISSLLIDSIAPGAHKSFSVYRSGTAKARRPKIVHIEYKGDPAIQIVPTSSEVSGEGLQLWQLSVSPEAKIGEIKKGALLIGVSGQASNKIEVPVLVFVK